MRYENNFAAYWLKILVPVSLCLMMLSGCSGTRSAAILPCPAELVPDELLAPCPVPDFNVSVWGDYPDYVAQLQLALAKCNTEKAAVARLLNTDRHFTRGKSAGRVRRAGDSIPQAIAAGL